MPFAQTSERWHEQLQNGKYWMKQGVHHKDKRKRKNDKTGNKVNCES